MYKCKTEASKSRKLFSDFPKEGRKKARERSELRYFFDLAEYNMSKSMNNSLIKF